MTWKPTLYLWATFAATISFAQTPITATPGHARTPRAAFSNGVLHLVLKEAATITYYRSTDLGKDWTSQVIGDLALDMEPYIAAVDQNVYIAWQADPSGTMEVYFTRSTDGGLSFESPQLLSADDGKESLVKSLAASQDGATVIVAYFDRRKVDNLNHTNVFIRRSSNRGASGFWGPELVVDDARRMLDFSMPCVRILPNGRVAIAYRSDPLGLPQGGQPPFDIQVQLSLDGGISFLDEVFVSRPLPQDYGNAMFPVLEAGSDNVLHAAWYQTTRGRNVFYSRSSDSGLTWSRPAPLSDHTPAQTLETDTTPGRPAIVIRGERVEVYWVRPETVLPQSDAGGDLYRAISDDGGGTWKAQEIVKGGGASTFPTAVTDGSETYLFYSFDDGANTQQVFFQVLEGYTVPSLRWIALVLVLALFGWFLRGAEKARRSMSMGLLVLFLLTVSAPTARAQTTALPLAGGTVLAIYRTDSGVLLAGTNGGGVYRSIDGGISWQRSSEGLDEPIVTAMAGDGGDLVVAGTVAGLFRSVDSGLTWSFQKNAWIEDLEVDPVGAGGRCYAATRGSGLLVSSDGCSTWSTTGITGLGSLHLNTVEVIGSEIWIGTDGQGLFSSADGGATWTAREMGLGALPEAGYVKVIRKEPGSTSTIYVGLNDKEAPTTVRTNSGDLYVTYNGGASWGLSNLNRDFYGVESVAITGSSVFVGTSRTGFYRSDGDPTLGNYTPVMIKAVVNDLAVDGSGQNLWAALNGIGVWASTDSGQSLAPATQGIDSFVIRTLAVRGNTIFVGGEGGVQRSIDGGGSFTFANQGFDSGESFAIDIRAIAQASATRIYAASRSRGFYVSDDTGATWQKMNPPQTNHMWDVVVGQNPDRLFVTASGGKIYKSTDAGASWQAVTFNSKGKGIALDIEIESDESKILITADTTSWVSGNGTSFSEIDLPGEPAGFSFHLNGALALPSLGRQILATAEGMMTRTLSYSGTPAWSRRLSGTRAAFFISVVANPTNPAKLVAASPGQALYKSSDGGLTWQEVAIDLDWLRITKLAALDSNTLLVGTHGEGLYKMPWP